MPRSAQTARQGNHASTRNMLCVKLKAEPYYTTYGRPIEIHLGINRKRQANLFDPDGTRTELMEPTTIDGKPTPSSTAPPPQ